MTYLWNTGETTESIVVYTTGLYGVTVTDTACSYRDTVTVNFQPFPNPNINLIPGPFIELCSGEEVTLTPDAVLFSQTWSTGDTTPTLVVSDPGSYWVTGENGFGCVGHSDTVTVDTLPLPLVTISLSGGGDTLFANPTGASYQWYAYNDPVPGETGQFYVPSVSGQYRVFVTDANGCSVLSDPFDFTLVGQEGGIADGRLEVFPNPVTGLLNISALNFTFDSNPEVRLYNALGQEITAVIVDATPGRVVLDLSVVSNGIYFVKVQINGTEWVEKVLKSAN